MNVIGLEEITALGTENSTASLFKGGHSRTVPQAVAKVPRWHSVAGVAIALAASAGSTSRTGRTAPHESAHEANEPGLAPLTEATMDAAWQSALAILSNDGQDVNAVLGEAAARVDAWRDHGRADSEGFEPDES